MLLSSRNRRLVAGCIFGLALVHFACGKPSAAPAGPVDSYAMRGEIVRLPQPGSREVVIRHEAVPGFRDDAGKVVGMEAMTMPFSLAPDLPESAIAGLAAGDRIAFTLEMRWQDPGEIARISRLEKLPAGTRLAWDEAPAGGVKTPAGTPP